MIDKLPTYPLIDLLIKSEGMNTSTAVVLAGGANSRFFPFNSGHHKGLVSLLGKPLLVRTLESLQQAGITSVVLILTPQDAQQTDWQQTIAQSGVDLTVHVVIQPEPKGAGNAIMLAQKYLTDSFIVTHPYYFDVGKVLMNMKKSTIPNVVCAVKVDDPWNFGVIRVDGGFATGIVEKPEKGSEPSDLKSVVIHRFNQDYLTVLRDTPEEEYSYEIALDTLMKQQKVEIVQLDEQLPSLKYGWDLFEIQQKLFETMISDKHSRAQIAPTAIIDESHGAVVIEDGVRIGDFTKIVGPAYIGQDALVGEYSFIRQSSLEAKVVVGANTEVARSILLDECEVHSGYVADSIIGRKVKIGAGLITANKRHDRKNIVMHVKGKKIETQRNNYGVMIGDQSKVGVRVTTMPGVMIGSNSTIMPGVMLSKNVEHGGVVRD